MWMMWMFCGGEVDKMWMIWMFFECRGKECGLCGCFVDVLWGKCG